MTCLFRPLKRLSACYDLLPVPSWANLNIYLKDDKDCFVLYPACRPIFLNYASRLHCCHGCFSYSIIIHKNVEPVLLPVPRCKGSRIALLVETSNVESPTLMLYITHPLLLLLLLNNKTQQGLYIKTHQGAFPLLCS